LLETCSWSFTAFASEIVVGMSYACACVVFLRLVHSLARLVSWRWRRFADSSDVVGGSPIRLGGAPDLFSFVFLYKVARLVIGGRSSSGRSVAVNTMCSEGQGSPSY
jgi:hypothetical protein